MTAAARALAAPLAKAQELPGAAFLLALLAAGFALASPQFLSPANLANVALQSAALIIVSLGMTLVILTEGIDLSAGAVLGLCGVVMSMLLVSQGVPLPLAVRWFNEGSLLGVPVPVLAMVAIFGVTWVLLYRTRFGRYVFAIGGNRRALELAGVPVRAWLVAVYAYAGLLAALASFIMTARMNAAHPTIGIGLEFDAIAAVILGGTSFEKGNGGIWGTLVGALAVAVLRNGLNLIGLSTEWQVAVVGLVIVSAVAIDALRGRV